MSRHKQRPELEFGSDSFLDVVCNIVGILIILIVVVAVRVERQPKDGRQSAAASSVARQAPDPEAMIAEQQQALRQLQEYEEQIEAQLASLGHETADADLRIQEVVESQELARQQLTADQEKAHRLQQQVSDLESDKNAIAARIAALQQAIDEKGKNALVLGQALATAVSTEQDLDQQLRTAFVETQQLQEVLQTTEKASEPKDRLQHRLSPVSKPAENGELHFRISNGRISEIPLEELLDRLNDQVLARRAAVMRFNHFEGTVGPVRGYNMTYTVEKEGPSTLEAIQNGDGRIRVSVSRWLIEPDASLVDESFAEAVRPGSRYRQTIETAIPDTVVTMWIYPDSFKGFGPLREVAHGLQLRVAARPLPAGTPIVGSPSGSRSTAQ